MPPPMIRVTFRSPEGLNGRGACAGASADGRGCARQFGAPLYQLAEDDPDFLLNGAAIPGRPETQIGFDGLVEFSDGEAGHGGLRK